MRRRLLALLAIGAFAGWLTACAAPADKGGHVSSRVYSGVLDWHFETSSFTTDDGRGPWWLSAEGEVWNDVVAPIQAAGGGPWGQVALKVEAQVSEPGRYGHMGAYEREIRVTRVIESKLIAAHVPTPSGLPSNN